MSSELKTTPLDLSSRSKILGLAGPARCGKSTAGEYFVEKGFRQLSFAIHLKRAIAAMLNMSLDEVEFYKVNEQIKVPGFNANMRVMQQTLGTEWGRELIDPDIWVKCTEIEMLSGPAPVVITDVRFENEAAWIRDQGGIILHIDRPGLKSIEAQNHKSERGLDIKVCDWIIYNEGSVEDFRKSLAAAREHYDWMVS